MSVPYLECARIIRTHGVAGMVKLENRCDTPQILASLKRVYRKDGAGYTEYTVTRASVQGAFVLMKLTGVDTVEQAAALKDERLYAAREDLPLPAGAYFIADLIGLPVLDATSGRRYGRLREVINRGASDIYVVDTPDGERMMPAVADFVARISPDEGIFVTPIPGLFDDDAVEDT